ncbi:MAG: hypothetical protein DIU70_000180 [Bacillota bacterium]
MRRLRSRRAAGLARHVVLLRPEASLASGLEAALCCGAEVLCPLPLVHGLACTCPGPAAVAALTGHPAVQALEPDLRLPLPRA